ncbi:MAG: PAAR domain-containing protein [Novosphingobium sp.]
MGKPAARIGDMHVCPMVTGTVPHVGGPIIPPCMPTVHTGGIPQARVGDMLTCVGPPDAIMMGSPTVLVGGRMAARLGDPTVHGGVITFGLPTVLIGEAGSATVAPAGASSVDVPLASEGKGAAPGAMARAMIAAAQDGTPFCEQCQRG